MTCVFPATSLTLRECDRIQNKFMQLIVGRSGYNRHMKLEIWYAPATFGGAGFRRLFVEQGVLQLLIAIKYLRSPNTQNCCMLMIALSWSQAFVGTSKFLWSDPNNPTPSYPSGWIESV